MYSFHMLVHPTLERRTVADLERAEPAPILLPLGDGLTPPLVVILANDINFYRSTVKHCTQSILNDCHQWLSDSFRVHQIRFRLGLLPGPHWGAYSSDPPDSIAGLRGPTSKGEKDGKWKGGRGEKESEGTDRPPLMQMPRSAP